MPTTTPAPPVNDYVAKPDLRILYLLVGLASHYGKTYCMPSQVKIIELLGKRYHRSITRRSLNRHLGALDRLGYVLRIRRHRRGPRGSIEMHSTIYAIQTRARRVVGQLAAYFARAPLRLWTKLGITAVPDLAQCEPSILTIMAGGAFRGAPPPA